MGYVKGLKPPRNVTVNFKPSERQYEMWRYLQPNQCPHCGGKVEIMKEKEVGGDKPKYYPQCTQCGSRHMPRFILGGGAAGKLLRCQPCQKWLDKIAL